MKKASWFLGMLYGILLFGVFHITSAQTADSKVTSNSLEEDLVQLLQWFPGEYDNHEQVYKEAEADLPKEKRHRQTHHIFYKVDLAFIPGQTLYAQQSQHYDLKNIYRQRIYAFEIDETELAIRLRIYTPKAPEKLTDGHLKPEVFQSLTEEDFFLKPGCDVFWKFDGKAYNGYLKENACSYYSESFATQVYLNETLMLRKDALLLEDTAKDASGSPVFGVHDKGPTINLKVENCN